MSDPIPLRGVFPMLPTPFDASGALFLDDIPPLVEFALEHGSAGVSALGLGGESAALTLPERQAIAEAVFGAVGGRATVIIGCTADDTESACALARHAADRGATALMVAPPRRPGISEPELEAHYGAVARAAAPVAIMVQDAPAFLGVELGADLALRLARANENVRYVKSEALPAGVKIGSMMDALGGRLPVLGGHGAVHLLEELEAGAIGTIPGTETVDATVEIVNAYADGDRETAEHRYQQILPLLVYMMQSLPFFLACSKELLRHRGVMRATSVRVAGGTLDARALHGLKHHARLAGFDFELTSPRTDRATR